ncbi:hypothetical protein M422DRAFT_256635 [Sphaerobolus stellatus SS14]|uniref:Uncharacterized protein n=1 Tax=Sphaerobolus stellatus (strain SS14) TaxID=990650 RepID=A0A0C9UB90_SPHS4|nr:hypothetical protein M422DRAFT_256635 [Sphaerobolus stellatus SS14]
MSQSFEISSSGKHNPQAQQNLDTIQRISGYISGRVLLAIAASASSILDVGVATVDNEISAVSVRALSRANVLDFFNDGGLSVTATQTALNVGTVAWAESSLNGKFSFTINSPLHEDYIYITPLPQVLPSTMRLRWISDMIRLQPSSQWIPPIMPPGFGVTALPPGTPVDGNLYRYTHASGFKIKDPFEMEFPK